jgi:hypothetical protein
MYSVQLSVKVMVIWLVMMLSAVAPGVSAADDKPAAVVTEFNAAISARDLERALACLAVGSVQLQLHPAHPGVKVSSGLTSDLVNNWRAVGTILFPATDSYERRADVTAIEESGDLATVWTLTRTESHRKQSTQAKVQQFSELYVLVRQQGTWKIAVQASNRQPDDFAVATPK